MSRSVNDFCQKFQRWKCFWSCSFSRRCTSCCPPSSSSSASPSFLPLSDRVSESGGSTSTSSWKCLRCYSRQKKIKTGSLSKNCFRSMRTIPKRRKTTRGTTASLLGGKSLIQTLRKKKVPSNLIVFLFQWKSFIGHHKSGNAYSALPNAHGYTRK